MRDHFRFCRNLEKCSRNLEKFSARVGAEFRGTCGEFVIASPLQQSLALAAMAAQLRAMFPTASAAEVDAALRKTRGPLPRLLAAR